MILFCLNLIDTLRRTLCGLLFACVVVSTTALAADAAPSSSVHSRTLSNGLEIFVKVDRRAPVAVSMLWYRAGSIDETSGTTGVAHVLEHMMFQGTNRFPKGEFSSMIADVGGRSNAFTSEDYTGYHQQLHKSNLELSFELEADRMVNLNITEASFAKELRVVMEERRQRVDDNPRALLYERLNSTMFMAHPYRTPVVGWMNDLENMQLSDARDWYDAWYAPNNTVLVVSGDVQPEQVFALAEKHFGPIPARSLPVRKPQVEPEQTGIKRVIVKAPARMATVIMAYHAPALRDIENDWEPYALSILAGVLDGHPAARLEREMVSRTRVAHSVSSDYDGIRRGPGAFFVSVSPAQGKSVDDVEQVWREQLDLLVARGVSKDELQRVKAQVIASQVYRQDSVLGQASQIGRMRSLGLPYDAASVMTRKLREVTPDQVRAVARKYLVDDKLTVAILDPQPMAEVGEISLIKPGLVKTGLVKSDLVKPGSK
jgi:zinc protease